MKHNDYNEFCKTLFKNLMSTRDNVVFSPMSALILLGLMADTVDGKAKEEIVEAFSKECSPDVFRTDLIKLQKMFTASKELISSNSVCIKNELAETINSGYEEKLAEFGGKLFTSSDIAGDVNAWVKENTRGMIPGILSDSMKQMVVCMLNAIAFEAEWKEPYEDSDIQQATFTNVDGSQSDVWMMKSSQFKYIEDEYFTGFIKPYKNETYSFMALLSKKQDSPFMKKAINKADFLKCFHTEKENSAGVTIYMPEFKIDYDVELNNLFVRLGIKEVFTSKADFSPLSNRWLEISSVLHKAHIEVDRKGTKAAALSTGYMCYGFDLLTNEPMVIRLDRPFIYAIMNNKTGLPVFTGVMNQAR